MQSQIKKVTKRGHYSKKHIAEVAQLVEHNLAKVRVAGSSPVFRSLVCSDGGMVDTQDLKSCDHYGCAGSSPAPSTQTCICL